jgi:phthiocerol/phenolphthiocerol synthesis type-I polyketide synthase C
VGDQRAGPDLLEHRFSGAEPVRHETLRRFGAAFAAVGFRREAFLPCYGLAAATLFVSGHCVGASPVSPRLYAAGLSYGRVEPTIEDAGA